MINIPLFENFLNEDVIYAKGSNKPLFNSMEPMSPANFLKAIKGTPEGNETNSNFAKGVEAVKFLSKNLKVPIDVYVYRSDWNYGGTLVVVIAIKGMSRATYADGPFQYSCGDGTRGPSYQFGYYFDGIRHPENGNMLETGSVTYGTYKSISKHNEVLQDIVGIFDAYEKKNGEYFNPRTAKKIIAERLKIENDWKKVKEKISPIFSEMWNHAKKLGITCNEPRLVLAHKEVRMRVDEPRQYRHENEYGGDTTSSKDYQKYSELSAKIYDLMESFAKKWNLEVSIAANWSY
jgi:hypothetical protein